MKEVYYTKKWNVTEINSSSFHNLLAKTLFRTVLIREYDLLLYSARHVHI